MWGQQLRQPACGLGCLLFATLQTVFSPSRFTQTRALIAFFGFCNLPLVARKGRQMLDGQHRFRVLSAKMLLTDGQRSLVQR